MSWNELSVVAALPKAMQENRIVAYEKNWVTADQCAELMVAMLFG